jgi:RNA polymerase sigma factor (sigma-70 family)
VKVESRDNDFQLIKRVKQGDTLAFRSIVEKYKDMSLSLACSILKDEEGAEDALQDAFLKVFKNIDKFRFDSLFSTWLYRIVVNTCLNAKEKRRDHFLTGILPASANETEPKSGLDTLLENERKDYIAKALNQMKPEEALLLRLYYLCDLSIGDIRSVTGLTKSNIKVMLHRGRKNFLEILGKLTGNDLKSLL